MFTQKKPTSRGFSIIEIVVAAAIITISVVSITAALQFYFKFSRQTADKTQAAILTEEGAEALQFMRDISWDNEIADLTLNTTYYLYWNGSDYVATTTTTALQNRFYRKVVFSAVRRDTSDSIVSSGGTIDANTRKATLTVSLVSTGATLLSSEMLIHDVYTN